MNIDQNVHKSQLPLKTSPVFSQEALQTQTSDTSAEQSSQNDTSAFQSESVEVQAVAYAVTEVAPNQVQFDTPQSTVPVMGIQNWEDFTEDPDIQTILEYIHETENQNIQALLDGLQKSLDNAHKIQQENMKHYYEKVRPQTDHLRKVLQDTLLQEKAGQVKDLQKNLSQLEALIQQMRAELGSDSPSQQQAVAQVLGRLSETSS